MKVICISVPDGVEPEEMDNYVAFVATELARGETSGRTETEGLYWSIEETS